MTGIGNTARAGESVAAGDTATAGKIFSVGDTIAGKHYFKKVSIFRCEILMFTNVLFLGIIAGKHLEDDYYCWESL